MIIGHPSLMPIEGYQVSDTDTTSPNYYGYIDKDGRWYIMKETISGNITIYRFAKGESNYSTNWTNRADLTYDYFSEVF